MQTQDEKFFLNNVTGSLLVAGSLDRETVELYSITVEAVDGGDPALRLVATAHCGGVFTRHFTILTDWFTNGIAICSCVLES